MLPACTFLHRHSQLFAKASNVRRITLRRADATCGALSPSFRALASLRHALLAERASGCQAGKVLARRKP
jgi:hypothetical protein